MTKRAEGTAIPLMIVRHLSMVSGIGIFNSEKDMPARADNITGFPHIFLMKNQDLRPSLIPPENNWYPITAKKF